MAQKPKIKVFNLAVFQNPAECTAQELKTISRYFFEIICRL